MSFRALRLKEEKEAGGGDSKVRAEGGLARLLAPLLRKGFSLREDWNFERGCGGFGGEMLIPDVSLSDNQSFTPRSSS